MSRSRLPRNLLLAIVLVASASTGASAQPTAPAAALAPACLPTCGSAAVAPRVTPPDTSAAAIARPAGHAAVALLVRHRADQSETLAAATRPACLPTCGSAAVAPRATPPAPSVAASVHPVGRPASALLRRRIDAAAATPAGAPRATAAPDSSDSGFLVRDAAMLGLALLVAGGAFAAGRYVRPLDTQPR